VQSLSGGLIAGLFFVAALVIALAILASPLFAAIGFVVVFGAFLVWRGWRRSEREIRGGGTKVPTTEEASADPEPPPRP
jgi:hypothetical protein